MQSQPRPTCTDIEAKVSELRMLAHGASQDRNNSIAEREGDESSVRLDKDKEKRLVILLFDIIYIMRPID